MNLVEVFAGVTARERKIYSSPQQSEGERQRQCPFMRYVLREPEPMRIRA